jgi:hypothetical protein
LLEPVVKKEAIATPLTEAYPTKQYAMVNPKPLTHSHDCFTLILKKRKPPNLSTAFLKSKILNLEH